MRVAVRGSSASIEQPEAYLMRSASNVWRDFLRKKMTHVTDAHEEFVDDGPTFEETGPDDVVQGDESVTRIIEVLNELTVRTRQVFVLCRVEGMRQKVVANRLGISVSAVEKHMIKAIAHLNNRLNDLL